MIELGMVNNTPQMHVNYYVKYNTLNKEEFIQNQILNNAKTIIQHLYSEHQKLSQKS